MGLHIELNTANASPQELRAVVALCQTLLGETALTPVSITGSGGVMPEIAHLASIIPTATRIPTTGDAEPYYGEPDGDEELAPEDDGAPIGSVPPPPVVGTPQAAAEALLQAEAARVAGASAAGVELDVNGMPWDMRIHSAEKKKNKDQTWRYRRNTDKALIAQVEAELKQAMAANGNPAPVVTDPAAAFGVPTPPVADGPAVTDPAAAFGGNATAGAVPAPPVDTTPAVNATVAVTSTEAPGADLGDFARVMRVVAAKQKAGTVTTEGVAQIAMNLGLTGVRDLAKRPDLIPAFEAMLP